MEAPETHTLSVHFFHFYAVFAKKMAEINVGANLWAWHPFVWEILDPPLLQQIIRISVKRITRALNGSIVLDQKTKLS